MKSPNRFLLFAFVFCALVGSVIFYLGWLKGTETSKPLPSLASFEEGSNLDSTLSESPNPKETDEASEGAAQQEAKTAALPEMTTPDPALVELTKRISERLASGDVSPSEAAALLAELTAAVLDAEPSAAALALVAELQKGTDYNTGLGFVVGDEGTLEEAPTWRTALLDLLGRTDPVAALDYSRQILATTQSPDEYSLALRTLGWLNQDGSLNAEITSSLQVMLENDEWLRSPSAGFLEAFDTAVALGTIDAAALVSSVLRTEGLPLNHPLNRAAFLALDRIMIRNPDAIISLATTDRDWLSWAPTQKASLLSRLDVRSPAAENLLRETLISYRPGQPDAEYFASLFPNVNGFSGNRMVSSWDEVRAPVGLDRASLEAVRTWMADPAFRDATPLLEKIEKRLEGFLAQQ